MFVRNWETVCCIVRTVQSIFATALKPSQLVHLVLCFVMGYVLQLEKQHMKEYIIIVICNGLHCGVF